MARKPPNTATLNDNESAPIIQFAASNSTAPESVSSQIISLTLSPASSFPLTLAYSVSGTATGGGTDHNLTDGTITIPPLSTAAQITISNIIDDSIAEPDETILITLSPPNNGATLGTQATHTHTITDNESAPKLQFTISGFSGPESVVSTPVQVQLTPASSSPVTVNYTISGTATGGGIDHNLSNGTLTIPPLATSGLITIPNIIDDSIAEPDESVIITLSTPSGATLGTRTTHRYTITDNEGAPKIQFLSPTSTAPESTTGSSLPLHPHAAHHLAGNSQLHHFWHRDWRRYRS